MTHNEDGTVTLTGVEQAAVDYMIQFLDQKVKDPGSYTSFLVTDFVKKWRQFPRLIRTSPKSAADCLAHCRSMLTAGEFEIAVALIEIYALSQSREAIDSCGHAFQESIDRVFNMPITAAEHAAASSKGERE